MSEYDEYGATSGAAQAPMPSTLPPNVGHPPNIPASTYHPGMPAGSPPGHAPFNRKMGVIMRPTNFKTNQRPMNPPVQQQQGMPPQVTTAPPSSPVPPPASPMMGPPPASPGSIAPASPAMGPPPQQAPQPMMSRMTSSMTSSSDADEYGQRASPLVQGATPRITTKIIPRSASISGRTGPAAPNMPAPAAPGSGRFPNSIRGAAPPPPQGVDGGSGMDDYGSPRIMTSSPLTMSGRAPPTGKFASPIAKQQQQAASAEGDGGVAPPVTSAPPAPKHPITTSSAQDDEYGSTPIQNTIHLPVKQPQGGSFPLTSSASPSMAPAQASPTQVPASPPVDLSPRRVTPAFKAPTLHKNPLATSAPPLEIEGASGQMSPSPVASPGSPVATQSGGGEETLSALMKKGSVDGYGTKPVERKRKERVNHTEFISVPKHLSEKPIRGIYSLNATNRSDWKARVIANNPNIGELYERIYPLERGIAFCKMFHPGQRAVKEEMKQTQVVQLILQHLQLKGFNATRRVLEKESRITTPRHRLHTSRLNSFIHAAIRDTDAVYDYVIGEKIDFGKQVEDKLWQMGLQEEEEENEEVDIWQEPADRVRYEVDNDPKSNVKCGSFNKLVELLTGEYNVSHPEYLPTFLLTYQSFSTPEKLLQKLVQRFNVPQAASSSQQSQLGQQNPLIIRGRVCNIMRKWIEEHPSDFNEKLNVQMKQFIDYVASNSATSKLIVPVNNSFQKMLAESKAPKKAQRTSEPPEPIIPQNFFSKRWDQWLPMELDEEEIARQLSLMDWEYFSKIKPTELLNQAWSKPKLKHRAPNVLAFIAQFNRTSTWAATEIVSAPTIRERVKVVTKLIKISEKLTAMNNYNSLMSISAALNCSSVSRLKHTFAELSPYAAKGKKDIDDLVTSDGNFKILRQRIAGIDPTTTPCIPYLGYILSDLTFTDENPDKIMGMINFNKRVMVYRIINGILSRQTTPYNFQPVQQIVRILRRVPLKPENELYDLSLKHEPRGAQRNQIK